MIHAILAIDISVSREKKPRQVCGLSAPGLEVRGMASRGIVTTPWEKTWDKGSQPTGRLDDAHRTGVSTSTSRARARARARASARLGATGPKPQAYGAAAAAIVVAERSGKLGRKVVYTAGHLVERRSGNHADVHAAACTVERVVSASAGLSLMARRARAARDGPCSTWRPGCNSIARARYLRAVELPCPAKNSKQNTNCIADGEWT